MSVKVSTYELGRGWGGVSAEVHNGGWVLKQVDQTFKWGKLSDYAGKRTVF